MKLWIKLQHWFYRILIDYKTNENSPRQVEIKLVDKV